MPDDGSPGEELEPRDAEVDDEPRMAKLAAAARRINRNPALLAGIRRAREVLPGDPRFGDPLSTAGDEREQVMGRGLAALAAEKPGALGEAGMSALQLWQAFSESQGRGRGDQDLAIAFTDLVGFSDWALEAGDDLTLALLRDVADAIEPPVRKHGGQVVKRLGDGMMAVFRDPREALEAVMEGCRRLDDVEASGYRPHMRAGLHVGRPRRIGSDYLGVDVNIAARVAEQASGNEVIVSSAALEALDDDDLQVRKKRLFRVKGVPKDLQAFAIART